MIGIGVLLLCLIGFSVGTVLAMYASTKDADAPYVTPEFYFESDMLNGETHTLGKNATAISFKLKNYADATRFAETDIEYTVTLTFQPENASPVTITKTGTITGGAANDVDITFDNLTDPVNYTVTASTTSPYLKTITATFVIPAKDYTVKATLANDGNAVKVTVKTVDYAGNVVLAYPASLSPDNTDPLMTSAGMETHTVEFGVDSEHTFVFFKADPTKTYAVSVTGTTVTISESN